LLFEICDLGFDLRAMTYQPSAISRYACPVKLPEGNGLAGLTGALCPMRLALQ